MDKRGNFSSIVATIGAILIFLGFAWLIALNWDEMSAPIKIFILLAVTSAAYISAIFLQEKGYDKIAHSLFVVGALLFTLSVFLVAQTFNLSPSLQGTAWLLFICVLGVTFTAYFFSSHISLVIALIEFLIWTNIQFSAILDNLFSAGYLILFLYLANGILFYGISLLHRAYEHKFAKLFTWWTAFYFLSITYYLSFQIVIQELWNSEAFSILMAAFLMSYSMIAIASVVFGVVVCNAKGFKSSEIKWVIVVILILVALIFSTQISAGTTGSCYEVSCYEIKNEQICTNFPSDVCVWENGRCDTMNCEYIDSKETCETNDDKFSCMWLDKCENLDCYHFENQTSCSTYDSCKWENNTYDEEFRCEEISCYDFETERDCTSLAPKSQNCKWDSEMDSCYRNYPANILDDYNGNSDDSCGKYLNNRKGCASQDYCKWNTDSYSREMSVQSWFVWIVVNLAFIGLILLIIGFGSVEKWSAMINLGIGFFILDVITRYIGFIMDFGGYNSLAVIFITGGILLIFGGWGIEKWRRSLINKIQQ